MTDGRDAPPPSSRSRRLSAPTMPEVPVAKRAAPPERTAIPAAASPNTIDAGDPAPELVLPNDAGVELALSALRGGPVLIVFAPSRPGASAAVLVDALALARRELGRSGATALLVIEGDVAAAAELALRGAGEVVVLADRNRASQQAYGVVDPSGATRLTAFLVDAAGDVARVFTTQDPTEVVPLALKAIALAR